MNNKDKVDSYTTTKTKFSFGNLSPKGDNLMDRDVLSLSQRELEQEIVHMITSAMTDSKDPKIFQGPREFPPFDSGRNSIKNNNSANVTQMDLVFNDKFLEHPEPQRRN